MLRKFLFREKHFSYTSLHPPQSQNRNIVFVRKRIFNHFPGLLEFSKWLFWFTCSTHFKKCFFVISMGRFETLYFREGAYVGRKWEYVKKQNKLLLT